MASRWSLWRAITSITGAPCPTAVLNTPVVLASRTNAPTAVLEPPVVLANRVSFPTAVLFEPVFTASAFSPTPVFPEPTASAWVWSLFAAVVADPELGEGFVRAHAGHVVEAVERICGWVEKT